MTGTRSVLINYAGYPSSPRMLVPDNGLASLAGALVEKGHTVTILDYATVDTIRRLFPYEYRDRLENVIRRIMKNIREDVPPDPVYLEIFHALDLEVDRLQREKVRTIAKEVGDYVEKNRVDFAGFKLWIGDGFEGSIAIARELKKRFPGLPVFAGGPHADWYGEKILALCEAFDVLVRGDGEEAVTMLADYVLGKQRLEDIPNLMFRRNGSFVTTPGKAIEDLNRLPLPVYDDDVYPAMKGDRKLKLIITDESRGCPNSCSFCLHPMKSGNRWRVKSPENVVNEMERVMLRYGIPVFRFAGSNTPPSLARGIAEEILKRDIAVDYVAFANSGGDAAPEDFQLLRRSGCYGLWFGVESADAAVRAMMNKRESVEQLRRKMAAARRAGIYTAGSIVLPAPGETERSKRETFAFLLDVAPDSVIVEPPVVIPGTRWDTESEKYGIEILDRAKFIEGSMFYKIKLLYPPSLLQSLPYFRINGKTDRQVIRETGDFNLLLEKNGILTQLTVDSALIAKYAGLSPREFRDRSRQDFLTGNADEIERQVASINRSILACGSRAVPPLRS